MRQNSLCSIIASMVLIGCGGDSSPLKTRDYDFNNDGREDLIMYRFSPGKNWSLPHSIYIEYEKGKEKKILGAGYHIKDTPKKIKVDDFNGDSREDIVLIIENPIRDKEKFYAINNGDGSFEVQEKYKPK